MRRVPERVVEIICDGFQDFRFATSGVIEAWRVEESDFVATILELEELDLGGISVVVSDTQSHHLGSYTHTNTGCAQCQPCPSRSHA